MYLIRRARCDIAHQEDLSPGLRVSEQQSVLEGCVLLRGYNKGIRNQTLGGLWPLYEGLNSVFWGLLYTHEYTHRAAEDKPSRQVFLSALAWVAAVFAQVVGSLACLKTIFRNFLTDMGQCYTIEQRISTPSTAY